MNANGDKVTGEERGIEGGVRAICGSRLVLLRVACIGELVSRLR